MQVIVRRVGAVGSQVDEAVDSLEFRGEVRVEISFDPVRLLENGNSRLAALSPKRDHGVAAMSCEV